jgi:soluble P-type ATPase
MIHVDIPGYGKFDLEHLVVDFNGTLALDGKPLERTKELLKALAGKLTIHVITADTFGSVTEVLRDFPCRIEILSEIDQHLQKKDYVARLGPERVVSIGNGRNDREMLKVSTLGIAVVNQEGAGIEALINADILSRSIEEALELLIYPKRLIATLRS